MADRRATCPLCGETHEDVVAHVAARHGVENLVRMAQGLSFEPLPSTLPAKALREVTLREAAAHASAPPGRWHPEADPAAVWRAESLVVEAALDLWDWFASQEVPVLDSHQELRELLDRTEQLVRTYESALEDLQ